MSLSDFFDFLTAHPGAVFTVLCMISGQFMKTIVFTPERAASKGRFGWFWRWGRRTLAWHPAVVGFVTGWLWVGDLEDGRYKGGTLGAAIYFATFGGLSVWAFEAAKGPAKKYAGIDLEMMGRTTPIPGAVIDTPTTTVVVAAIPKKEEPAPEPEPVSSSEEDTGKDAPDGAQGDDVDGVPTKRTKSGSHPSVP